MAHLAPVENLPSRQHQSQSYDLNSDPQTSVSCPAIPKDRESWRAWAFIRLVVKGLPLEVTTWEIYESFKSYGNLSRITIFETRDGFRSTRAEVTFEPPPARSFWLSPVTFKTKLGQLRYVDLEVSERQRSNFTVNSPVRKGVKYNERTELVCDSLDFGILNDFHDMTIFESRGNSQDDPKLVLDLRRREIEVSFPSVFKSDLNVATRRYRFLIAMDDAFSIWRVDQNSYVLHLSHPPWYSKQLRERLAQTHSVDGKSWSSEDTWARQTDIFGHKRDIEVINSTPVSLEKTKNTINIARWTTFRLNLQRSEQNSTSNSIFLNVLKDFNIQVKDGRRFKFSSCTPDLREKCWSLLNGEPAAEHQPLYEQLSAAKMPFSVRYQLEVCLSQGWLSEYAITDQFIQMLVDWPEAKAKQALVYVDSFQSRVFDPMEIFSDIKFSKPTRPKRLPEHCAEIHSATVTASTIEFNTPTIEITNRIIRKYKQFSHRFLRVRFEDDNYRGQTRLYPTSNNKMILIFQRVKRTLERGVRLADAHYEFLAWGNSQLREHGAYFFARAGEISADSIRAEMGDFEEEKVVAKRAARMGQCFSTTRAVPLKLPLVKKLTAVPDIVRGKYNFTDGVGKISDLTARLVSQKLRIKDGTPSVFQFRRGGCKGILAIAPELQGIDIKVRLSQFKFDSAYEELEIIRWSEFWQPYLNRQLILCLSSLGVPDSVFLRKQEQAIAALDAAMNDDRAAVKTLRENIDPNMMTLNICDLVEAGFRKNTEPFVSALLMLWRSWALKYLKEKAKIPVVEGAFVLGTVDETGTLQGYYASMKAQNDGSDKAFPSDETRYLPEIFIQIKDPRTGKRKVIEGICVLARNPSLHRGDIRVVMARDVPALYHLCDVVVMPQNGDRDLPSMCSGGDLDGDDYIVFWDKDLIPKEWNAEPFHYEASTAKKSDNVTIKDMIDFFYNYMQNDCLGRIAHAHLGAADFLQEGLESSQCKELVQLHSMAVDYPKTGTPAKMNRKLERNQWPHFMEKKGRSYHSRKILGQLYDAVERVKFKPNFDLPFDSRILLACDPPQSLIEGVQQLKQDYDNDLQRILAQHNIKTEFELWSTFVLDHSKASREYKFHEEVGQLSRTLKEQYHEALCDLAGGKDFEHLAPVAVAAYKHCSCQLELVQTEMKNDESNHQSHKMPFISFPWILQDVLIEIAKNERTEPSVETRNVFIQNVSIVQQTFEPLVDKVVHDDVEVLHETLVNGSSVKFPGHMIDPILQSDNHTGYLFEKLNNNSIDVTEYTIPHEDLLSIKVADEKDERPLLPDSSARNSCREMKPDSRIEGAARVNKKSNVLTNRHIGPMVDPLGKTEDLVGINGFIPDEIVD